jgi:hypothetical protein
MDALTDPARIPSASGAKQQGGTTSISQASSLRDFFTRFPWPHRPSPRGCATIGIRHFERRSYPCRLSPPQPSPARAGEGAVSLCRAVVSELPREEITGCGCAHEGQPATRRAPSPALGGSGWGLFDWLEFSDRPAVPMPRPRLWQSASIDPIWHQEACRLIRRLDTRTE